MLFNKETCNFDKKIDLQYLQYLMDSSDTQLEVLLNNVTQKCCGMIQT